MIIERNKLTPQLFLELYTAVGWEPPHIDQVKKALDCSVATFTAYEDEKAIGMVRLLGDRGMSFYLKDFAIIPAYQAKGIGTSLLREVEKFIKESIKQSWAVSLELISTNEAVAFYKKHGFEERPCDWDGPGMIMMIR